MNLSATAFFEDSPLGFALVGAKLELLEANAAFKACLGAYAENTAAWARVFKAGPLGAACMAAIQSGKTSHAVWLDLENGRGETVTLRADVFPVPREGSRAAGVVLQEMGEPGGVEGPEDYAKQTRELMREMDAFAYSVSHDLRAPLRAIVGFSQALSMEAGSLPPGRSAEYLERVLTSAERMNQMMDQLLKFSRAARQEPVVSRVDVSALAEGAAQKMLGNHPGREVEWRIEAGLTANTDEKHLRTVLEILFDNSLKFTARQPEARIEFGAREAGGEVQFYVRDNGAGYDPIYAEKLFAPFQRLHAPDDFPGEGMGLAIARRIVRRLGGRIGGEAEPERGATFFFTVGNERANLARTSKEVS